MGRRRRRAHGAERPSGGEQQLLALLSARLPEGSTVTDTRFAAVRQGDRLTVVLKAECLEQIGQTVTLPETETTQR